jgi:uncharacterized protein
VRFIAVLALAAATVLGTVAPASAQDGGDGFEVLVYTRTTGFRHASIPFGIQMVEQLGADNGFEVEATEDPTRFRDDVLADFDVIVFLNTTGEVMDDEGRAAMQRFVEAGGGYVGIHSAADTEYDWRFYGRLFAGAYFKNHPIQQPGTIVREDADHPSTAHLPDEWQLPFEEFYAFQRNPRPDVHVLLTIDEDSYGQDPNTSNLPDSPTFPEGETGTMGDHPMAWCHDVGAGHAWYTALGHEIVMYEMPEFRQHVLGGILTAAGRVDADCPPGRLQGSAGDDAGAESGRDDRRGDVRDDDGRGAVAGDDAERAVAAGPGLPDTGVGVVPVIGALIAAGAVWMRRRR